MVRHCSQLAYLHIEKWGFGNFVHYLHGALELVKELRLCPIFVINTSSFVLDGFVLQHNASVTDALPRVETTLTHNLTTAQARMLVARTSGSVLLEPSLDWFSRPLQGAFAYYLQPNPRILTRAKDMLQSCCAAIYIRTCNPAYMHWGDTCVISGRKNRIVHDPVETLRALQVAVNCSGRRIFLATDSHRLKLEALASDDLNVSTFVHNITHPQKSRSVEWEPIFLDWFAIAAASSSQRRAVAGTASTFLSSAACAYQTDGTIALSVIAPPMEPPAQCIFRQEVRGLCGLRDRNWAHWGLGR